MAPAWQTFGIHLKVPIDRLQGFHGEYSMVERCFTEVLVAWLRGEGACCTVEQLVSALGKPGVDQKILAKDIEKNRNGESDIKPRLRFSVCYVGIILLWAWERG